MWGKVAAAALAAALVGFTLGTVAAYATDGWDPNAPMVVGGD
jgi:ABC-type dipeptide/oligopeptide/nickel transport system permease subunit